VRLLLITLFPRQKVTRHIGMEFLCHLLDGIISLIVGYLQCSIRRFG